MRNSSPHRLSSLSLSLSLSLSIIGCVCGVMVAFVAVGRAPGESRLEPWQTHLIVGGANDKICVYNTACDPISNCNANDFADCVIRTNDVADAGNKRNCQCYLHFLKNA